MKNPFSGTGTPLDQLGALLQPSFDAVNQAFGQLNQGVRQYTGTDPAKAVQTTWRDPSSYAAVDTSQRDATAFTGGTTAAPDPNVRNRKRGGISTF